MHKLHQYAFVLWFAFLPFSHGLTAKGKPKRAPVFHVVSLDGDSLTIGGRSDRLTVLNFWATWCSPCVAEISVLNKLVSENADHVLFVAITEESSDSVRNFFQNRKINFRYYQVTNRPDIAEAYQADKTLFHLRKTVVRPVHIVIDQNGRIIFDEQGASKGIGDEIQSIINRYTEPSPRNP